VQAWSALQALYAGLAGLTGPPEELSTPEAYTCPAMQIPHHGTCRASQCCGAALTTTLGYNKAGSLSPVSCNIITFALLSRTRCSMPLLRDPVHQQLLATVTPN